MHNITKMSDYYSGIEELFNPPLTYSGNYGFPLRALKGQNCGVNTLVKICDALDIKLTFE